MIEKGQGIEGMEKPGDGKSRDMEKIPKKIQEAWQVACAAKRS